MCGDAPGTVGGAWVGEMSGESRRRAVLNGIHTHTHTHTHTLHFTCTLTAHILYYKSVPHIETP